MDPKFLARHTNQRLLAPHHPLASGLPASQAGRRPGAGQVRQQEIRCDSAAAAESGYARCAGGSAACQVKMASG